MWNHLAAFCTWAGAFYHDHAGTIMTAALAIYGWWNNWFSAFVASLPNPDEPTDWNADGTWRKYKLVYKAVKQHENQKPVPLSLTTGVQPPPKLHL